ncbi:hypothetical protein [Natronosalvus rutilus]|uniref:Uncharacterized protein n=1 Tax=Natronosalvus rutilus TaxID=2953753 RepID=A0A9E7NAK5_9EURY|nr:hypothetical protein [Natronosalvus rutilus]UTF53509.1 hypothetical protein NGM29_17335 [Natronosalvus rutilus]
MSVSIAGRSIKDSGKDRYAGVVGDYEDARGGFVLGLLVLRVAEAGRNDVDEARLHLQAAW